MTRADALRDLIRRAETDAGSPSAHTIKVALDRKDAAHLFFEVVNNDSLNAAARLEAPLRELDWSGPLIHPPEDEDPCWSASWLSADNVRAEARSYHEARARLRAVLRALLHEAEASS